MQLHNHLKSNDGGTERMDEGKEFGRRFQLTLAGRINPSTETREDDSAVMTERNI